MRTEEPVSDTPRIRSAVCSGIETRLFSISLRSLCFVRQRAALWLRFLSCCFPSCFKLSYVLFRARSILKTVLYIVLFIPVATPFWLLARAVPLRGFQCLILLPTFCADAGRLITNWYEKSLTSGLLDYYVTSPLTLNSCYFFILTVDISRGGSSTNSL